MKAPVVLLLCASLAAAGVAAGNTVVVRPAFENDLPRRKAPVLAGLSDISPLTGMSETDVLRTFGARRDRSTPGLWVYWGYYGQGEAAELGGDTLVLAWRKGRVTGAKLVNGDILRRHLGNQAQAVAVAKL